MNAEKVYDSEQNPVGDGSPWGEAYLNDLPPFNPDQAEPSNAPDRAEEDVAHPEEVGRAPESQETEAQPLTERGLAEAMYAQSQDYQDNLVDWINSVRSGDRLSDEAVRAYEEFQEDYATASEADWVESLEEELKRREVWDRCLITAIEDLDRPENAGKTLEGILTARSEREQGRIDAMVKSGAWEHQMTDAQRTSIVERRNTYKILAESAPYAREVLGGAMDGVGADSNIESGNDDIASESQETIGNGINIASTIEDLQEEIQKRERALDILRSRDQRDYGDDVLRLTVKLHEKQADLRVLERIQQDNHEQSEVDDMVTPENATATITKYISSREAIIANLTEQRSQYTKGSKEYQDLTKKRSKWMREIAAAHRVGEQLKLSISSAIEDEPSESAPGQSQQSEQSQAESEAVRSEPEAVQPQPEQTESEARRLSPIEEEEIVITSSEIDVRIVMDILELMRPDLEQLFAMCKGSLGLEQATGYLLISNQRMVNSTDIYANMLENSQNLAQTEQFAGVYGVQLKIDYDISVRAVNAIRQKAQTLPVNLRGEVLHYCQTIENNLTQIMQTAQQRNGTLHETPAEQRAVDNKGLESALEEEISM